MKLSRLEIQDQFNTWLKAWNEHDLEGVLEFMHEGVTFENWNGSVITGKSNLRKLWTSWFRNHGNFIFILEDFFIDEHLQKMTFSWQLDRPSAEKKYFGEKESRKGVDIMQLKEGKIYTKNTYSKTVLIINSHKINLTLS